MKLRTAHRRVSASGLDVARRCPSSFVLPAVDTGSSDAATAGTDRHRFLDEFATHWSKYGDIHAARAEALALAEERTPGASWLPTLRAIDLEEQLQMGDSIASTVRTGQGYAYHPETQAVEPLGGVENRAYTHGEPWISGTYDWLMLDRGDTPTLVDYKGSMRTTPAKDNLQLAFYAACVAKAHGYRQMHVELRYIHDDGQVFRDRATLDEWDLAYSLDRVSRIAADVASARAAYEAGHLPAMSIGTHCSWCPSLRMCPAQITALREVLDNGAREALDTVGLTPELAGQAWVRIEGVIALADRIKSALRERAVTEGGLPLPDGDRLAAVSVSRATIDADVALPLLRELVGDRADSLVQVERKIENASIDRIATELAKASGGKIKDHKERLWQALEPAVTRSSYTQLKVKK